MRTFSRARCELVWRSYMDEGICHRVELLFRSEGQEPSPISLLNLEIAWKPPDSATSHAIAPHDSKSHSLKSSGALHLARPTRIRIGFDSNVGEAIITEFDVPAPTPMTCKGTESTLFRHGCYAKSHLHSHCSTVGCIIVSMYERGNEFLFPPLDESSERHRPPGSIHSQVTAAGAFARIPRRTASGAACHHLLPSAFGQIYSRRACLLA